MAGEEPAAFFGGLKKLQSLNLCFAGSFSVLLRFGISPAKIGCFIGDTSACLNFWNIVGDIFGVLFGGWRGAAKYIAGVSAIALLAAQCRLFYICMRGHGDNGVRKYFFWLCFSACVGEFESQVGVPACGDESSYYFLALELYNVFLPLLFGVVTLFGKCFGFDIDYWKLLIQLFSICLFTFVSAILWFAVGAGGTGFSGFAARTGKWEHTLSPFFMGILGMGSIFWLFPVVWPFMVCHFSWFRFIMLFAPGLGAFATLIVWVIAEHIQKASFNKWYRWTAADGSQTQVNGELYHLTWLFLIPVVLFAWMFFKCLHNPRGYLGNAILYRGWAVLFGSLFFFSSQSVKAFGLTGCAKNAFADGAGVGPLNSIGFGCSIIHLTASLFTVQAYSIGFASFKCALDSGCSWPTQGLGGFRSFWFWHRYGVSHGTKRFMGLWKIDIVSVIS